MTRPPVITTTDRIIDTLLDAPFNLKFSQALDFAAYLCGIEEDKAKGWHSFRDGEHAHILARLENCTDAEALKDEWVDARHSARNSKTKQQLEQEAATWLY